MCDIQPLVLKHDICMVKFVFLTSYKLQTMCIRCHSSSHMCGYFVSIFVEVDFDDPVLSTLFGSCNLMSK